MLIAENPVLSRTAALLVLWASLCTAMASAEVPTLVQTDEQGVYAPAYISPHTGISYQHSYGYLKKTKYGPDARHFDYVNPEAPKGGAYRLPEMGSWDSFNPIPLCGRVVRGMFYWVKSWRYLWDTLMHPALDEPASFYGLIAQGIAVGIEGGWVAFKLREGARWHDGLPITVEDVLWTFATSKSELANPVITEPLAPFTHAEQIGPLEVKFYIDPAYHGDPFGSLSPRLSVQQIIEEGLAVHEPQLSEGARQQRVDEGLRNVGLDPEAKGRFPHEFSGGQRQRIAIARALVLNPKFIVMDEPTSALDMSVQAQIVDLLRELQQRLNLAYLFISHDLKVVRALAHYLVVMKDGAVVEQGPADEIFSTPKHGYSQELLAAAFRDSTRR